MRRVLSAIGVAAVSVVAAIVPLTQGASAASTQRFYFHASSRVASVDTLTTAASPSFDTTAPTEEQPAVSVDAFLDGAGNRTVWDASWTGRMDGVIESVELDLWMRSNGDGAYSATYDPKIWVDGDETLLAQIDTVLPAADVPAHLRVRIDRDAAGAPLAIDATGKSVTLVMDGHYTNAQTATAFFFDSTTYPAGFTVNPPLDPAPHANLSLGSSSFTAPKTMPNSNGHSEPSITIAAPGTKETAGAPQTIYVGAIPGLLGGSTLWRTDDNGATFSADIHPQNVGDISSGLFGGGDVDIKTDKDGNLFFADLWLGNDALSVSADRGDTWFGSPVSHASLVTDRQWLGYSAEENAMYLTYNANAGLLVSKADLDTLGAENSVVMPQETVVVDQANRGCLCPPGSISVDDTRPGETPYVYITYSSINGLGVARSDNGGLTFTQHIVPGTGANTTHNSFEVSGVDDQGRLYVAWAAEQEGSLHIFYSWSGDHAETWHGPFGLSSIIGAESTALFPAIAVDGDQHVAIAFYGTPKKTDVNATDASDSWNVYLAESTTAASDNPTFDVSTVTTGNHVGGISTGGLTGGGDRSLGDFFSIAFDKSHFTHLAYNRDSGTDVAVAYQRELPSAVATTLTFGGPAATVTGRNTTMRATLTTNAGVPVAGATVSLRVEGLPSVTATTDSTGVASASVPVALEPGRYAVALTFNGSPGYLPSAGSGAVLVQEAVAFAPDSATTVQYSDAAVLSAIVTDATGPTPVTFRLGTASATTLSDAAGRASATFTVTDMPGNYPVSVTVAGRTVTGQLLVTRDASRILLANAQGRWTATLTDGDSGAALSHRIVDFSLNGSVVASVVTDALGQATTRQNVAKGSTFTATFDGDSYYVGSQASQKK